MFGFQKKAPERKRIEFEIEAFINQALAKAGATFGAMGDVARLKEEISTLKIEKGQMLEGYARTEREIEHKLGLERTRQKQELEHAKKDVELKAREANLISQRGQFEEQMRFERGHTEKQIASLNVLVTQLLERLPSAKILMKTDGK